METVVEHACQLLGRVGTGKIGTAHVPDKQCVAGQYRPRLSRLLIIHDHERDALRSVARSFEKLDPSFAETQFEAVVNRHVRKSCSGLRAEINIGSSARGKFLVSGDKIRM